MARDAPGSIRQVDAIEPTFGCINLSTMAAVLRAGLRAGPKVGLGHLILFRFQSRGCSRWS